jgi:hypothetical protein
MSKGFSINDILGAGAKTAAPAGQKMQVVMLPAADIEPNPENSIYEIGDVSMLKADIASEDCAARWRSCLPTTANICCWPDTAVGPRAVR